MSRQRTTSELLFSYSKRPRIFSRPVVQAKPNRRVEENEEDKDESSQVAATEVVAFTPRQTRVSTVDVKERIEQFYKWMTRVGIDDDENWVKTLTGHNSWLTDDVINPYLCFLNSKRHFTIRPPDSYFVAYSTFFIAAHLLVEVPDRRYVAAHGLEDATRLRAERMPKLVNPEFRMPKSMFQRAMIFIPRNEGNLHWTSLFYDVPANRLIYYDGLSYMMGTLAARNEPKLRALANAIVEYFNLMGSLEKNDPYEVPAIPDEHIIIVNDPKQLDGSSCGVIMCMSAKLKMLGVTRRSGLNFQAGDNLQKYREEMRDDVLAEGFYEPRAGTYFDRAWRDSYTDRDAEDDGSVL